MLRTKKEKKNDKSWNKVGQIIFELKLKIRDHLLNFKEQRHFGKFD